MKILVSGGAGFIASHVSEALLAAGHDVHILDDLSGGRRENVPDGAVFHEMDIRSREAADCMLEHGFEAFVHHAAQMDVRKSVADPRFDATVNILGLLNIMEAGRRAGLKKVVFASTGGAIYGEPDYAPQDERHATRPLSPYGVAKLCSERYLDYYRNQYGVPFVALRYGNVYGPRQNPHGEAGVIAIFAQRMLRREQAVVYGDGLQTRDYVYVDDVVQANLKALDYDESGIFNIGTATETSVNDLFDALRDRMAPNMTRRHEAERPGEQRRSVLGCALAREALGWVPRTTLAQGLEKTAAWFEKRMNS